MRAERSERACGELRDAQAAWERALETREAAAEEQARACSGSRDG